MQHIQNVAAYEGLVKTLIFKTPTLQLSATRGARMQANNRKYFY